MIKNTMRRYYKEGSKINQVFMATMVVLPVLAYGQSIGWMSPMTLLLQSKDTPAAAPVDDDTISWMASVTYIVGTPAVFLFGYIADNCGRKKALLLTSASMAACWMVKLASTASWALILGRAITGLVVAGCYVVTPLYMKEISEDSIRGALGSLVILSQNLGNVMLYIMGDLLSYHAILWICLAVPLLHILVFIGMPETPSYLLKCGKYEEARSVLAWLTCRQVGDPQVDLEMERLLMEAEQNSANNTKALKQLVTDRATFRAFRITLMVNLAREVCGCIAVLMFASSIFDAARRAGSTLDLSPNKQAALLGAVQFVGSCVASSLVERTGRKPLLATTCAVSGVSMALLGAWFHLADGSGQSVLPGWIPVVALCVCIFCDAGGLQPVPFVIMTEIFSFQLRGIVTTLVIAFACALDSAQLRVFTPVVNAVGFSCVFWIFSGVCLLSTLYIILYVPETKMRSLQEIYEEIGGKKYAKKLRDVEAANADFVTATKVKIANKMAAERENAANIAADKGNGIKTVSEDVKVLDNKDCLRRNTNNSKTNIDEVIKNIISVKQMAKDKDINEENNEHEPVNIPAEPRNNFDLNSNLAVNEHALSNTGTTKDIESTANIGYNNTVNIEDEYTTHL